MSFKQNSANQNSANQNGTNRNIANENHQIPELIPELFSEEKCEQYSEQKMSRDYKLNNGRMAEQEHGQDLNFSTPIRNGHILEQVDNRIRIPRGVAVRKIRNVGAIRRLFPGDPPTEGKSDPDVIKGFVVIIGDLN